MTPPIRTGTVIAFGPDGWGRVAASVHDPLRGAAGDVEYDFHSTAIADGSRRIELGAAVSFTLVAGRQGRWEASNLTLTG